MTDTTKANAELRRFELECIGSRRFGASGSSHRAFVEMADLESLMLLQLGTEIGIFPIPEAERLLRARRSRFLGALKYLDRLQFAQDFRSIVQVLTVGLRAPEASFTEHPDRLSPDLFGREILGILFHELTRLFRKGYFTSAVSFFSPNQWGKALGGKLDPDSILRKKKLTGINGLISDFLEFLGHAASLDELWDCIENSSENNYAFGQLRRRVRAVHGWRMDLHEHETKQRFETLTGILASAVDADEELASIGFEVTDLLTRITPDMSILDGR